MPAFSPTIGRFGDVTARGNHFSLWLKHHRKLSAILILIAVIAGLGAGGWWYWQSQYVAAAGGEFHEGLVGSPEHLNPLYSNDNPVDAEITPLVFRGLLSYTHQKLQPDLATDYEVSEDGKTYTLTLGQHQWHDGQPVTAQDAAFTIKLTQDPTYTGTWSKSFTDVTVSAPDTIHLKLTLKEPYAPFAQNLTLGLLPEHLLKGKSAQQLLTDPFNLKPVGTGKLKFQNLALDEANKAVDQLQFELLDGYLDAVVFDFYPTQEAAVIDYKLGKLQALGGSYSAVFDQLQDIPGNQEQARVLPGQSYGLYFNIHNQSVKDVAVRQALAYATPKDQIIDQVLHGHADVLTGVYPTSNPVFSSRAETYPFNLDKAKDTLKPVADPPKRITLLVPDKESHKQTADQLAAAWDKLGISTKIVVQSTVQISDSVKQRSNYDVVLLGEKAEPDPDRYPNWHSTQQPPTGHNITGEENKRVDKALEDGRKALKPEDRKQDYDTFQYYLAKDAPVIWLYQPHYIYVWSNKVHGVKIGDIWNEQDRFETLQQWYMKTERKQ